VNWPAPCVAPTGCNVGGPPSGDAAFRPFSDEGAPCAPVLPGEIRGMEMARPRYQ